MDARSAWIWLKQGEAVDQYAEFYDAFTATEGKVTLKISADSNYAVYLNGKLAASGQYADFPHYKVFDEIDVAKYCRPGHNHLAVIVWYYGQGNMGYYPGKAALRYEVWQDEELSAASSPSTLSRQSRCYTNGLAKTITGQLGFSFHYDLTCEDDWITGRLDGFEPSCIVDQELRLYPRPVARPEMREAAAFSIARNENNRHYLIDLGREEVGFLTLRATSECGQDVLITYGEHIADGQVRRLIGGRDFSVEVKLRSGLNEYLNPFRRLGLRYMELYASSPIELERLTVCPAEYPLAVNENLPKMDELQRRIYDTCVRTLVLCMHEHYEDSPWREQALYAMDSRNQMLCGYDAFGEYDFARANLLLMSKDERPDGLLSICTPSSDDLTIPSFSLHYFTAVYEYTLRSGDLTLARENWPKLVRLIKAFTDRIENGCVPIFEESCHWNFYEWSPRMSGQLRKQEAKRYDAALNFLLCMALKNMQKLADALEVKADYAQTAEKLKQVSAIRFFDSQRGVFFNSTEDDNASILVNALAVLCGAAEDETAAAIAQKLAEPEKWFTPISLSMVCFQYDAMLMVDEEKYRSYVLDDIAFKYGKMLDAGATAFWETELGESDFDNAGSLCHGWSAMPVHYYHRLLTK